MSDKKELLREKVKEKLDAVVSGVNTALQGKKLAGLEPVLTRLGRGSVLPHWYAELKKNAVLPNLDGKTIGSVVEMLFVAVLETKTLADLFKGKLRVNPARGVDLPDLDLGIKSPSENFCTSEPFYSAYERLLGGEYDIVVLLTDYQDAKKKPPLRLQIIGARYLNSTQIADSNLCALAKKHRAWLIHDNETRAQKYFRFLAYVNQSDWLGKQLVKLLHTLDSPDKIDEGIKDAKSDFDRLNKKAAKTGKEAIPQIDLQALIRIHDINPRHVGLIEAADNWVLETWKEAGRGPNDNEWGRLKSGPLDGAIGMSFALQWRYNFGRLFGRKVGEEG